MGWCTRCKEEGCEEHARESTREREVRASAREAANNNNRVRSISAAISKPPTNNPHWNRNIDDQIGTSNSHLEIPRTTNQLDRISIIEVDDKRDILLDIYVGEIDREVFMLLNCLGFIRAHRIGVGTDVMDIWLSLLLVIQPV